MGRRIEVAQDWAIETPGPEPSENAPLPEVRRRLAARFLVPCRALASQIGTRFVDAVFPPSCIECGAGIDAPHGLCPRCWRLMPFVERPFCERMGTPFAYDIGGPLLSPAAIASPPVYGRARCVARHDGGARILVHRLKYGDRLDIGIGIARLMAQAGAEILADADVVMPVPLHPVRLWSRRFNQSAVLARHLAASCGKPVDLDALRRRKRTQPQVGLTRAQRDANVTGAFHVPIGLRPRVIDRSIVLIDDVYTTGATVSAAARVLLRAGARNVDVLTFSRVMGPA